MFRWLMLAAFMLVATPVSVAGIFNGIEERTAVMDTALQGDNSYHAHLARKLAAHAGEEKSQGDTYAARQLMNMAEENACKAGGK